MTAEAWEVVSRVMWKIERRSSGILFDASR